MAQSPALGIGVAQSLNLGSDTEVFQHLKTNIGQERFKRICSRKELSSFSIPKEEKKCSHHFLKVFLSCLFDIQKEDLDEIGRDAKDAYKTLVPFSSFDEFQKVFLGEGPTIADFEIDKVASSGKGLRGLSERVFVAAQHHFFVETDASSESAALREDEMLASRFVDREIPEGSVVHLNDGIYHVAKHFVRQGAFVIVLQDVEGKGIPKILCRGTAFRRSATSGFISGLNDALPEMGSLGVKAIWPGLEKYLKEKNIESVEVIGKSLGGAIAQQIAILVEGLLKIKVTNLVTVNSVGIGDEVNELFRAKVVDNRTPENPFKITVIRNGGEDASGGLDYVPVIGGTHLGAGVDSKLCAKTVYTLAPTDSKQDSIAKKLSAITYLRKLLNSLKSSHCRQTTIKPFVYSCEKDPEKVDALLQEGNLFERVRRVAAFILKICTFATLDHRLKSHFEPPKEAFLRKVSRVASGFSTATAKVARKFFGSRAKPPEA